MIRRTSVRQRTGTRTRLDGIVGKSQMYCRILSRSCRAMNEQVWCQSRTEATVIYPQAPAGVDMHAIPPYSQMLESTISGTDVAIAN